MRRIGRKKNHGWTQMNTEPGRGGLARGVRGHEWHGDTHRGTRLYVGASTS
jgi:hypothetical protein